MNMNTIVDLIPLKRVAKLFKETTLLQKHRDTLHRNAIVLICDASSSTLTLASPLNEELWAWHKLDASFDDEFTDSLWIELDAVFFSTLIEKTLFARHIKLEINTVAASMAILSGKAPVDDNQADLFPNEDKFIPSDASSTLRQNIKILDTLSDYDLPPVSHSEEAFQLSKSSDSTISLIDDFNKTQGASVADYVAIQNKSGALVFESSNFSIKTQSIDKELHINSVLDSGTLHALRKMINLLRATADAQILFTQEHERIILRTKDSVVFLKTQEHIHRPMVCALPKFSEADALTLNKEMCIKALEKLDAKQKKIEDFVFISLIKNDTEKLIQFESEPEAGQLSLVIKTHIGLEDFEEIKTLRSSLIAALKIFNDDVNLLLHNPDNSSDEFYVTTSSFTSYVALQKLQNPSAAS
ncbi:hypothetical protein [Pseudidiomarina sp. CB1]|uniref:hypothetical protein n=1 Tax=Pseudidiomarina sp. CB1 TaxID=2972484 RepID=UPI002162C213|nr:hypothetical protein [Pseudidiomarina sp. CB1]